MAKRSIRLKALHQVFEENGLSSDTIELSDSLIRNINMAQFFQLTVQLLVHTINKMLELSGKTEGIHEKAIVSVDGKESRRSKKRAAGQGEVKALQTLNVYLNDYGMCLAQKFIEKNK